MNLRSSSVAISTHTSAPVASALGIEPTEEETATARKAISNVKIVCSGGLPLELSVSDDNRIASYSWSSTDLSSRYLVRGSKSHRSENIWPLLPYFMRATIRESAEPTEVFRVSCG